MSIDPDAAVTAYLRPDAREWRCPPPDDAAHRFHTRLPGHRPTPLVEAPSLAAELGVGRVFVKDESQRFGLPAFKVLGASWAVARLVLDHAAPAPGTTAGTTAGTAASTTAGTAAGPGPDLDAVRLAAVVRPAELVTATDGNHGRAVAYLGRLLGLPVRVFVPAGLSPVATAAIAGEGATLTTLPVPYDDVVEAAAAYAGEGGEGASARLLVQDTAWPGYTQVPAWTVEGYDTVLREVDAQLAESGVAGPDLVGVPVGVGSLAQAVVAHYRAAGRGRAPAVLGVEPVGAACLLASLQAGTPTTIDARPSVMAGLTCGRVSSLAWPVLHAGLDAAVAVDDDAAVRAAADLAPLGVPAGPCGGAALAGARAVLARPDPPRGTLGLDATSVVVLLSTEGAAAVG